MVLGCIVRINPLGICWEVGGGKRRKGGRLQDILNVKGGIQDVGKINQDHGL